VPGQAHHAGTLRGDLHGSGAPEAGWKTRSTKTREKQGNENTLPLIKFHLIPLNHQIMGYLLDSEHMHENHGKIAPKRRTG